MTIAQRLAAFKQDKRGATVVIFALTTPLLLAVTAAGVDYASTAKDRTKVQIAVDAAVLAAVSQANRLGGGLATRKEEGKLEGERIFNAAVAGLQISSVDIQVSDTLHEASVTAWGKTRNKILQIIDFAEYDYKAYAKAGAVSQAPVCLLSMDTSANPGITFKGKGTFKGPDCAIRSNATTDQSMLFDGSPNVSAKLICASGRTRNISNGGTVTPAPTENCAAIPNPLADWTPPSVSSACTYSGLSRSSSNETLTPGVYCGNTNINADQVTLNPGVYVIQNGTMSVKGNTKLRGEGVLLLMSGSSSLEMISSGDLTLTADSTISGKSVVIAQRSSSSTGSVLLSGNTKFEVQGSVNLPNHAITATGNSNVVMAEPQTTLIGKTITIDGSGSVIFKGREIGASATWVDGSSFTRLTQ